MRCETWVHRAGDGRKASLEHAGETFKIPTLAGHLTLRDTEDLARLDKQRCRKCATDAQIR